MLICVSDHLVEVIGSYPLTLGTEDGAVGSRGTPASVAGHLSGNKNLCDMRIKHGKGTWA